MEAIKYRISGQRKIVTGFAELNPDPESTRLNIRDDLAASLEAKAMAGAVAELEPYIKMMGDSIKARNQAVKEGNHNQADVHHARWEQRYDEYCVKQKEVTKLKPAFEEKRKELARAGVVYLEATADSVIPNLAQYNAINTALDGLAEFEAIELNEDLTFQVVPDFSGRTYWLLSGERWESHYVDLVGEPLPDGAILDGDITELQRQDIDAQALTDKIAGMTTAEKTAELAVIEDRLAGEAALMKSKLEIQGVSTALTDSQSWYQAELAKAQALYA
jgi:hypothetical protein